MTRSEGRIDRAAEIVQWYLAVPLDFERPEAAQANHLLAEAYVDVSSYTRATWAALCAEVAKLKVSILDGKLLELATDLATSERKSRNRWSKIVGVVGIEPTTCTV